MGNKKEAKSMDDLIEALNILDEYASHATQDNDNGEAQEQERVYNMLFDFLKGKQAIRIPMSYTDTVDIQGGHKLDWTFTSNKGQDIDVEIVPEEEGEE